MCAKLAPLDNALDRCTQLQFARRQPVFRANVVRSNTTLSRKLLALEKVGQIVIDRSL